MYPLNIFRTQSIYLELNGRAIFEKTVNNFYPFTTFAKKLYQMFEWVLNKLWAIMSEAHLECS